MGGNTLSVLLDEAIIFDSRSGVGPVVWVQAHKNGIQPNRMKNHPMLKRSFFLIVLILSLETGNLHRSHVLVHILTISTIQDACVKI